MPPPLICFCSRGCRLPMSYLMGLGFAINWENSALVPTQIITFIGLSLNSVAFRARLSAERVKAFQAYLALFHRGTLLKFRMCLRLLGLMESALMVTPFGRLYMRPFQQWVISIKLSPSHHSHRQVLVSTACIKALPQWKRTAFLTAGIPMGTVMMRKVVTTDTSQQAMHEGRTINGTWSSQMWLAHINCLELLAVLLL